MHTDTCTLTHPLTSTRARAHTLTHAHTHTRTHTHTHARTHARTRTHTHIVRHHTHTHTNTHAQQMKQWRQQQALLLVPCFAAPLHPPPPTPPTTPPPTHAYGDNFRNSGEGITEEVRFEAGFKRCERWRQSCLYRDRVPHTRRLILERPCTGAFQVNTWDTEQFVRR